MKSRIVPGIAALALVLGFGWWLWSYLQRDPAEQAENIPLEAKAAANVVTFSPAKLQAAGIEVAPVEDRTLQPMQTVPGRVQYDDARHVEVKAPTLGSLTEVHVKPGDRVEKGQVLAVVSSPDVGHARADVLKSQSEAELAEAKLKWRKTVCDGLRQLTAAIESGRELTEIAAELKDQTLGDYREQIVSAYSRQRLASTLAANVAGVAESGAVAGRMVKERLSERDASEAALKSIIEQSAFDSKQQCATAQLAADDAQRRLLISQQHLNTLLGYADSAPAADETRPLSQVEVRAPFAGTVETRTYGVSERVAQGDSLFVLADTSRLWVAADIREREWNALKLRPGEELGVHVPAMPDKPLTAKLLYLGREVSPRTNAVPVVATIENSDGLLRPGQFVQVRLPLAEARQTLAVPDAAIVEHEGQPFVFRRDTEGRFHRVDVTRGITCDGWTEITGGLAKHDEIAVRGAFYLKSELLLEGEE